MAKAIRYFIGSIERETEKAVLANFCYHVDEVTLQEYTANAWLPKSQIEVYYQFEDGDKATVWKVPLWLMNKNHLPSTAKKTVDEVIRMSNDRRDRVA